jgi:hypothetical protein
MAIKNLERLHASVRSAVETYCQRLLTALGSNIESISVYGSAAGPDFVPGKSNVNLVVVVGRLSQEAMASILDTVKWGQKKRIVPPLLLSSEYVRSSLDVFPIEFYEIKESQVVLSGEDLFTSVEVKPDHLRLECESQLKAALLRTRQAYLEVGMTKRGAESVLHASLTSLIPVFRAMLRLKGLEAPKRKIDVVNSLGEAFDVGTETFTAILRDKAGDEKIGGKEAHQVLGKYTADIEKLATMADQL